MKIEFTKKPQNVRIIEGFPGFGLVGTITTEYLIDHLADIEKIGNIWFNEMNPLIAIHQGKVIDPLGIFYSKKYNLVLLHAVTNVNGVEWKLAEAIKEVVKTLNAKELICVEGVGALAKASNSVYYISDKNQKNWDGAGAKRMDEGIVMGVTAAVLLKSKGIPLSCILAETASNLPDSRASAKVIKILDQYLGLQVDPKPLLKKAVEFEGKLKGMMKGAKEAQISKEKKEVDYMG